MSKIGKKNIIIPQNVKITNGKNVINFEGPLGCMNFYKKKEINVKIIKNEINLSKKIISRKTNSLWGLSRALINNIIIGITIGYKRRLLIKGVGYKANLRDNFLFIKIGYSHDVVYAIPEKVRLECIDNIIEITSCDKQLIGQICYDIKNIRKINIYKGKGIKLYNEKIILKQGKKK